MVAGINDREIAATSRAKIPTYRHESRKAPCEVSGGGRSLRVRYRLHPAAAENSRIDGVSSRPVMASARNAVRLSAWIDTCKYFFIEPRYSADSCLNDNTNVPSLLSITATSREADGCTTAR